MMAATIGQRLRDMAAGALWIRQDRMWRLTWRLAAQSVALILVMLVALEVVVYVITQQTLLGSLEDTLKSRAIQFDPNACARLQLPCGPLGRSTGLGQRGRPDGVQPNAGQPGHPLNQPPFDVRAPAADQTPSDASVVYIDPELHIVHSDGILQSVLLDPGTAQSVLHSGKDRCCVDASYRGQEYLVYTRPLFHANGSVAGAVQTSISKHQYDSSMQGLLRTLLAVALLGVIISGGISAMLVRRALMPIRVAVQRQRDFVADAAHELRTPLAILRTVGEVGLSARSVDDLQATIEQMLGENQHLTRLVDDLSLLARTDTNSVSIERRPVAFSDLVSDTAGELRFLVEEQGVNLDTDIQHGVHVTGDMLRLRQLILILLDNALKHTPTGGTVRVTLAMHSGRARLQIADSGAGIDPSHLPRIFDRFYRADESRTGEGSGLGLAIGKWIVEAHGGQIHAENTVPHGALFTVTLPVTRAPIPTTTPAPARSNS